MYRENIFQFIKDRESVLFLPKNGGLFDYVTNILTEDGMNIDPKNPRIRQCGLDILLRRGEGIPQLVQNYNDKGIPAYGLTGDDLFDEFQLKFKQKTNQTPSTVVLNTYDWLCKDAEYKRPALCLMNSSGKFEDIPDKARVAVNQKYELTSRAYLARKKQLQGKNLRVEGYPGDTESTVSYGINDCCIEIVYGGGTRKENNLEIVDEVRFSDIVLIGKDPFYLGKLITEDLDSVRERSEQPKQGSYTTNLLTDQKQRRDKIISEAAEVFSAIEGNGNLPGEIADLVYALNCVIVGEDIDIRKLESVLEGRLAQ
jgi:phosphoribosyl-ATP pyrophosphohydrolase